MHDYAEEILESQQLCTSYKLFRVILDAKYKEAHFIKVMKN